MTERCLLATIENSSIRARCNRQNPFPSSVVCLLFLLSFHGLLLTSTASASICSGCFNGGQLFLPNNIFGPCRCVCSGHYMGPQCEFVGKRSAESPMPPESNVSEDTQLQSKFNLLKDIWWRLKDKLEMNPGSQPDYDNSELLDDKEAGGLEPERKHYKSKRPFGTVGDWLN